MPAFQGFRIRRKHFAISLRRTARGAGWTIYVRFGTAL